MKKSTILPKKITLTALGLLSAFSSVATIALLNANPTQTTILQNLQSNQVVTTAIKTNRNIVDNITNNQDIRNPDEVFYTSEDLATKDVWDTTTNAENATNKAFFTSFKTNLESTTGSSTVKDELLKINDEIDKYVKYKEVEHTYTSSPLNDTIP